MNEMELLSELAQETPLPAAGELDAARARLVAAIATDPATYATAVTAITAQQPYPSGGQPVQAPRPPAPAPVLSAVKLLYGGALGTAVQLILGLGYAGNVGALHMKVAGHQVTLLVHHQPLVIALALAVGLAEIALWLWTARAVGQGRTWARILSPVMVALATLELIGTHGVAQLVFAVLAALTGLAAVCLLWRPASIAYFRSTRALRSRPPSQIPGR
jgi:hypothetical protein